MAEKLKKFLKSDYESFEDMEKDEQKKVLVKKIKNFYLILQEALEKFDEDKLPVDEIKGATTLLESMNIHTDRTHKFYEALEHVLFLLESDMSEEEKKDYIEHCHDSVEMIKETFDRELEEAGYIMPVDPTEESEMDEAITTEKEGSIEMQTVEPEGGEVGNRTPVEDPEELGSDMPEEQHEKVATVAESPYEAGFQHGRKLWEQGRNIKEVMKQLTEAELCEKPYKYVTRYQEGLQAGWAFEEEVRHDTEPNLFQEKND
jgi:hypothetical protein